MANVPRSAPHRYQGYVPQGRFKFECSDGALASSWAPHSPSGLPATRDIGRCTYNPVKERFKPRMDKYTIGYTGHLPKAEAQIEQSYARIARGVELNQFGEPVQGSGPTVPGMSSYKPYNTGSKDPMPDYKLPGYTGFVPQNNFQFEKRYSQTVLEAGEQARHIASQHH